MKTLSKLLFIIATFFFQSSFGANYYVSISGNDASGNGSQSSPWRTLKYAVGNVTANQGHLINVSAGVFVENGPIDVPVGVNIKGAGTDSTTFKAVSSFYYYPSSPGYALTKYLIRLQGSNPANGNQKLEDFTIDGDSKKLHGGIYVKNRNYVNIENVKVTNTNFNGIWLWDVKYCRILNSELQNCSWGSTGYSAGALNLGNVDSLIIDNIHIDENTGYGIKAIGPSGYNDIHKLHILNSYVTVNPVGLWNNGSAPNIAIELWQVDLQNCEIANSYVDNTISLVNSNANPSTGVQTIRVHHNTLDMQARANGAGYAIELTIHDAEVDHNYIHRGRYAIANWDNAMKNWKIHHNVFFAIEGTYPVEIVRSQWSGLHNVEFYNNTVEFNSNKTTNVFGMYGGSSNNITVKNNLFIDSKPGTYSYYPSSFIHLENSATLDTLIVTHNLFKNLPVGSVTGSYSNNIVDTNQHIKKTGIRPTPYYLALDSNSLLIDAGTNVGYNYNGNAPDIGAYEHAGVIVNQSPLVSITSPAVASVFFTGDTVLITANASDPDGSISKVEFYEGSVKLGEDFTSPYALSFQNVPKGNYNLSAKAFDNLGATNTSSVVNISVIDDTNVVHLNNPPSVSITSPASAVVYFTGDTIDLFANANDIDGFITKVEFYEGSNKLGEDLNSPYSYSFRNVPKGNYIFTAQAYDDSSAMTVSSLVYVSVIDDTTKKPTVPVNIGLDAADATLRGVMTYAFDTSANKNTYFYVPASNGTNYSIPPPARGTFNFSLPQKDVYEIWVRVKSGDGYNKSFYAYDGNGNWYNCSAASTSSWTWIKITNAYTKKAVGFNFNSGKNSMAIAWKNSNLHVDRIIITNDTSQSFNPNPTNNNGSGSNSSSSNKMLIYPNPATNYFNLEFKSNNSFTTVLSVVGTDPTQSITQPLSIRKGLNKFVINTTNLNTGYYSVILTTPSFVYTENLLIRK